MSATFARCLRFLLVRASGCELPTWNVNNDRGRVQTTAPLPLVNDISPELPAQKYKERFTETATETSKFQKHKNAYVKKHKLRKMVNKYESEPAYPQIPFHG